MTGLAALVWPEERLAGAVTALAHRLGAATAAGGADGLTGGGEDPARVIDVVASRLELEAEPQGVLYPEVERWLAGLRHTLLRLPAAADDEDRGWLVVLAGSRHSVLLLGPDLRCRRRPLAELRQALCAPLEAPLRVELEALIRTAGVPAAGRPRALRALLGEQLARTRCTDAWVLRLPPGAAPGRQLRHAGLRAPLAFLVAAHAAEYALLVASWWVLGRGALSGRLDPGWLWAWALLIATLVPLRAASLWSQGRLALGAGALLKRRLLAGALRLEPEEIRHQGAGQLLGRVIESESVEALALSGGFLALLSTFELALAAWILSAGVAGAAHAALLTLWVGLLALLGWRYFRERERWTRSRIAMTDRMVERMIGHRTRLAQERRERWHEAEDSELFEYLRRSAALDRRVPRFVATAARGWLLASLLLLGPAFVWLGPSAAALAVTLGGILLAYQALQRLVDGFVALAGAAVAWRQVAPLYHAAARSDAAGMTAVSPAAAAGAAGVVETRQVAFRYPGRARPVLAGCDLRLRPGDRILLEGPSGSGKSTLAALLAGLRHPETGLVLLHGLDRHVWGEREWRRRVAVAPQFHENHVFTGSLAFNLLLGRGWPPTPDDLTAAAALCDELGLGPLLQRMPAGLMQPVGETGWQLSHGERSRLYLARALLQGADAVLLDESFAALDPESLKLSLHCAVANAPALLVVAHP